MNQLLINGCYDEKTLRSFIDLGVSRLAFDLRAKSPNLVPFNQLKIFSEILAGKEIVLIFENDRTSTILSFLDMLKSSPVSCVLEFRDYREADYYKSLQQPFFWMFEPGSDWLNILQVPHIKGVLLPISMKDKFKSYHNYGPSLKSVSLMFIFMQKVLLKLRFMSVKKIFILALM